MLSPKTKSFWAFFIVEISQLKFYSSVDLASSNVAVTPNCVPEESNDKSTYGKPNTYTRFA
jgi:hypothetical protein